MPEFQNDERWKKGEYTNQMSMLGYQRYSGPDESLPIVTLGTAGGQNAIFASTGTRPCTPLNGNTFRIGLSEGESIKDIILLLTASNDKIAKSNKYQTPLFVSIYLLAGGECLWRQKPLPSIALPGLREKQAPEPIDLSEEDTSLSKGGTVFVAGLSATFNLKYIT